MVDFFRLHGPAVLAPAADAGTRASKSYGMSNNMEIIQCANSRITFSLLDLADGNYGFNDVPFAGDRWTRFQRLQKRISRETRNQLRHISEWR